MGLPIDLERCVAPFRALGHAAASVFFVVLTAPGGSQPPSPRDGDLLVRLASGDRRALKALFDSHAPQVLAVALRILHSAAEAEEVVQDTFVEVWRRAAEYDTARGGVLGWILTIARTRAIDRLRSRETAVRTQEQAAAQPAPAPSASPLELAERRQDRERIRAALTALPEDQRTALELAYFSGLTHREIADQTQTPMGTVKTRLRLALEKIAAQLGGSEGPR